MGVIVLFSGGLDSTVCATMAHADGQLVGCLFVDYGQPAAQYELEAARMWCIKHHIDLRVYSTDMPIDTMAIGAGMKGARVVPGRNAILLSLAVSYACEVGAREVWYGATRSDWQDYADCRSEFVSRFSDMAYGTYGVSVRTPLGLSWRADVRALALELGVDAARCWSCYEPKDGVPCGTCNSCRQDDE